MDLSSLGKELISTDKPAGEDVRYDPAYDELQTEVEKLSSPAAAGSVDWEKVDRFATDILRHKSKDLLVASYLAVALIHTRGDDGFAIGLTFYVELIERFWDELYPQKVRMRGRVRALEWWLEKTEAALKQVSGLSFAPDQLALVMEHLDRLENFLGEHLDNSPSLAPIKEYFNGLEPGAAEKEKTEAPALAFPDMVEEEPAVAALESQQESQDATALHKLNSQQDAAKALSDGLMKVSAASFCLWQQDLASPQAYRLARKAAWSAVDELPPSINGETKIPPPPSQIRSLLSDLRNNGDAEALLIAAESRQPQYIFWIDLNRLVTQALARLGSRFEKAHEVVCQETAFLIHRLPGLEELSFSDGTPFATSDTRLWLNGIALRAAPSDAPPLSAADSNAGAEAASEAVIENIMVRLQQLVRNGQLIEAMEVIQQKLRTCSSRRDDLLWRLSLSRMLVDVGRSGLAVPHLEQVLKDIAGHGLEQYDQDIALRGLKLAWLVFDSQPEQKFKDQALDVLHQIGRLDMPEMVRLTNG